MNKNEEYWNNYSDEYQSKHGGQLNREDFVWGVWSIPESELNILGNVKGKHILELGCGAAQLSIAVAKMGGIVTGLDISDRQLGHAKNLMKKFDVEFELIHSGGDCIPLEDDKFDIVFCDHGAMTYSPTIKTLQEVNRVLKNGGIFAFNIQTPFLEACYNEEKSKVETFLCKSYFDIKPFVDDGLKYYQYTTGQWVKMFNEAGFNIIRLEELSPKEQSESSFDFAPKEWAMKYPAENIWVLRKNL